MRRSVVAAVGLVGFAGAAVLVGQPASAAPEALVPALQRDLGLSGQQVRERLAAESASMRLLPEAKAAAGGAYAGSWLDSGALVVAVTDGAAAEGVAATGARTTLVAHTEKALEDTKAAIDAKAAPKAVTGWYVDTKANSVVVKVLKGSSSPEVSSFLDAAKAAGPVTVQEVTQAPRLFAGSVTGGVAYYINGSARCSIGFSVSGGFVSAGHCGSTGDSVTAADDSAMGTFEGSSFPGNDYSYVATNSSWSESPVVDGYGNGDVTVTGSTAAAEGASICRSGSTTGWHCGEVQALNQTVNYAEGSVSGLTETNVCAEPGDSGGSWVSGSQAQGVTSGGSGDCTSGGTTYFQPVNEILNAYGLSLTTG
ncbi:S1 family peptidase [Actinokineospora bangkokensis]|uniref:Serine protease n=1 Tax=Actinokineospora bangkokensis TaxID=1193682 RepID=A0A1Q9LH89_9PSEU|nr:S1 family peptidase [Actinokineospora bangkokensis]OLR91309.1 serine protease [Actinokineospora bangkokensis]